MSITVLKAGLQTTAQDLGRYGHQHLGVPVSGAMDSRAHRLANLMAGNTDDTATLEITLSGPTLRFDQESCIAISGAQLSAKLNGRPVPNNRPLVVKTGDILAFGRRESGLRAYLAVFGGLALDPVMGSQSTYVRGGFGGFQGRALKNGDVLPMASPLSLTGSSAAPNGALSDAVWALKIYLPAILGDTPRSAIRAMRGPHSEQFTLASQRAFFSSGFQVGAQSERMGYRLTGPTLETADPVQLLSEAISFGSVQVPPDGQPIILMADRQTTGGYPKIAQICSVDLPWVAQTMPGETLKFDEVTLDQAQQLDRQREQAFDRLSESLVPLRTLLTDYKNKL